MTGIVLLLALSGGVLAAAEPEPAKPEPVKALMPRGALTNEGVLLLAEAGFDEAFINDLIGLRPARFDTSVEGLASLSRRGLSERIIRRMIARELNPDDPPLAGRAAEPQLLRGRLARQKVLLMEEPPRGGLRWIPGRRQDSWYVLVP